MVLIQDDVLSSLRMMTSDQENVSGAGGSKFPATAQTYFCDSCSPLRSTLPDLPLPLPLYSRSSQFSTPAHRSAPAAVPLIQFSARSAPFSAPILLRSHSLVRPPPQTLWMELYRVWRNGATMIVGLLYVVACIKVTWVGIAHSACIIKRGVYCTFYCHARNSLHCWWTVIVQY